MAAAPVGSDLDLLDAPQLRALIRAGSLVASQLELADVLRQVAEAARELTHARFAGIGVLAPDGGLQEFVQVGTAAGLAKSVGAAPEGDHAGSAESFLGVPIRVGAETYGNLYLADREAGSFTPQDERLLVSFARIAASAIANARRYAEAELRQQWLAASAEIGAQLLAESGEDPLQMIARCAHRIGQADLVAVVLVTPDGHAGMVEVAIGDGADELVARQRPLEEIVAGQVILRGEALHMNRNGQHEPGLELIPGEPVIDVGPVMVLPLAGASEVRGALVVMRREGCPAFSAAEVEMAGSFASHASIALEVASARVARQRVALLEDRDRIARDLHDHVIQQLFAVGLSIEGIAASVEPTYGDRLRSQVADIDRTIRQIRTSIFELRGPLAGAVGTTRQRVIEMASELSRALGFSPQTTFSGQVDLEVVGEQADDLIAVVREALTNVAKHAGATLVRVDLAVVDGQALLTIADNGRGLTEHARTSGLGNMRHRAERWGGSFVIEAAPGGGTTVKWKVPVR